MSGRKEGRSEKGRREKRREGRKNCVTQFSFFTVVYYA
jgi:hypothetical protein